MTAPRCWGVIPAAGAGRRMGGPVPKQYLELAGATVLEHSIGRLLAHPEMAGVCVALSPEDERWPATRYAADPRVLTAPGGAERCHSVRNALERLAAVAGAQDWVLVHDAARPCLRPTDLDRLIRTLRDHPVGGVLGMVVRDTMKRTDPGGTVTATVDRSHLWHAFTPQMFRLAPLWDALDAALAQGIAVTDDAGAMELAGHAPQMVEGHPDNLKITHPTDLELARFYLEHQPG